jgi:outer membrane protein OmpA-like peptidoglycan-associated protein
MSCATKKFVETEIDASEERTQAQIEDMKRAIEETQTEIRNLSEEYNVKIEGLEQNTDDLGRIARDNAEMIAALGQLRFQKTLSEAEANFNVDSAKLTDGAKAELDKFAQLLLTQKRLVHLEIQGHTDSTGSEDYNVRLGKERADAVREYLYKQHDIPLHLMNIISFGSTEPIAENSTRSGRAQNRRVVLVVRIQV